MFCNEDYNYTENLDKNILHNIYLLIKTFNSKYIQIEMCSRKYKKVFHRIT